MIKYKSDYFFHFLKIKKIIKSYLPIQPHKVSMPGSNKSIHCVRYIIVFLCILFFYCDLIFAQSVDSVYSKDTRADNKTKLYRNIQNNAIIKNLSLPLTDSSEENWMDAFWGMELIRYKTPWADSRIYTAFDGIEKRGIPFKRALLELVFTNYSFEFTKQVTQLMYTAETDKIFAMCAEYLMKVKPELKSAVAAILVKKLALNKDAAILNQLDFRMNDVPGKNRMPDIKALLHHPFFENATIVFSFQRRNRNYPGLVILRDSVGDFVKDIYGSIFSVPQLARSITDLPGYLTNGNTPQGIFRMFGTDVSRSNFIGPTPNIQLTMPYETSLQHFMNDSFMTDTSWTTDWYKKLLPESWNNYYPIYGSFYAGKAGRTEIISHGTTINPDYYRGQPYYPLTPSLGCLCTKEIWDEADGRRIISDQQKLVSALLKAGGANGYVIVIELNDEQRPVEINDVLSLLSK